MWIEVQDSGGAWTESTRHDGRGHGLRILRSVASESGIDGGYTGRAVWARFDWPPPPDPAPPNGSDS